MVDLSSGQVVADKYRIDGVIGAGGMGVVVGATHLELDQRVAIKFLRDATPEALARFQREARLIVRLKSAHVARVFDIGALDDDTPFIVMEFLEGEDLSKVIDHAAGGRIPVEQAVDYVLEACEAVGEAHTLGMVHRDLKPANLFLARGPGGSASVKVLDFGISKNSLDERVAEGTAGGLTNEGVALGSPGYMSPEQMTSSRDVDARADIYALGAILYRLVGGQNPYKGDSLVSVLASMAMTPLAPLQSVVRDVPDGFARIVERCLAQEPSKRPTDINELAQGLVRFGSRRAKASAEQIALTMRGSTSGGGGRAPSGSHSGSTPSGHANGAAHGAAHGAAQHESPSSTLLSAPSSSPSGDRRPAPAVLDAPGLRDQTATEVLGATVVSPLSAPSSPSHHPSAPPVRLVPSQPSHPSYSSQPSHPSYPPLLDRSATAPAAAQHRRDATTVSGQTTNMLAALAGLALLAGVIAWVGFNRPSLRPTSGAAATTVVTPADPSTTTTPVVTASASAAPPPPPPPTIIFPTPSITTAATATPSVRKPIPHHPTTPTTHRPSSSSAPPSPTDVPGGRR